MQYSVLFIVLNIRITDFLWSYIATHSSLLSKDVSYDISFSNSSWLRYITATAYTALLSSKMLPLLPDPKESDYAF